MSSKRKRDDDNQVLDSVEEFQRRLALAIKTYESAEVALLWIMKEYRFDLTFLQQALCDGGLKVSFSNVKYKDIAEFVGLDVYKGMDDIQTFNLHRSRMPTSLFKSIVEDMDIMLLQYGPLPAQKTEETKSRFFSPIFNRLVAEFGFSFRNLPELIIDGRITTKGRIEYYFRAFGSVSVLVIEVKLKIGDFDERLDAIAQVIAECDACDWLNATQGFRVPVYGILCDGASFEFFSFDDSTTPSFKRGCLPDDPPEFRRGLRLSDFTLTGPHRFICELRPICEIIFDLLLGSYSASLLAFYERSERKGKRENKPRKSLPKWDEALKHAKTAVDKFRAAEGMRRAQLIVDADATVEEAMKTLKLSISSVPMQYINKTDLLMTGWNDSEVERV